MARTILQFFHWYYPEGGHLWSEAAHRAEELAQLGISDVWLPPAYKGAQGGYSVGYDSYDLFDLGEFDQKGSIATKYGTRAQLDASVSALHGVGIKVIHDAVLNHKLGADEAERVTVQRVNPDNRNEFQGEPFEVSAYTRFTFPGRGGQHSRFEWNASCFSGVDFTEDPQESGVFRICNEYGDDGWNQEVDAELGNFDYLMGADIEFRNPAVYEEVKYWGRWMVEQVGADGFRMDAAKHIPAWFLRDWVGHLRETVSPDLFVVAEYWNSDLTSLSTYLDRTHDQFALFDVGLQHNFHNAGRARGDYDLRQIFDGSLVGARPEQAVTIVANHDTQPLQDLESPVEPWFKPLAYALILLREQGTPCLFYPDLYGAHYEDTGENGQTHAVEMPAIGCLPDLIRARRSFGHGPQTDLFEEPNCIAFIRHGTADAAGCVVVMSNGGEAAREAMLGPDHASADFVDVLGHRQDTVATDADGKAMFPVNGESVSVWVRRDCL